MAHTLRTESLLLASLSRALMRLELGLGTTSEVDAARDTLRKFYTRTLGEPR